MSIRIRTAGLAITAALAAPALAHAGWETPAGPAGLGGAVHAETIGGVPHAAWITGSHDLHVARISGDGGGWQELGAGTLDAGGTLAQRIVLADVGGVPHAAWTENDGGVLQAHAARYDATANEWVDLPSPIGDRSDGGGGDFGITIVGHGARPVVAFVERDKAFDDKFQVRVRELVDGAWRDVGGPVNVSSREADSPVPGTGPTRYDASEPELLSTGGSLYVAWSEFDGWGDQVHVARLAGEEWREIGDGERGEAPSLAAVRGVVHLAWTAAGSVRAGRVRSDGSGFDGVGSAVTGAAPSLSAAGDALWLAWRSCPSRCGWSTPGDVRAARLSESGTAWQQPSDAPVEPGGDPRSLALTTVGGVPHLAFDGPDVRLARLVPDFLETQAVPDDDGVTLLARVRGFGIPYATGFAVGDRRTATQPLAEGASEDTIVAVMDGLTPDTEYAFRPFARAGTPGDALGPASTFRTDRPARDGADGEDGVDGVDGAPGADGADGRDGVDGRNGADGARGADGSDGADGAPGEDGATVVTAGSASSPAPLVAIVNDRLRARRGRRVALRFLSTTSGAVALEVLRRGRRVARVAARARMGTNRVVLRTRGVRPGLYRLRLTLTAADGRTAVDTVVLRVVRR